jgi:hypothetical protein
MMAVAGGTAANCATVEFVNSVSTFSGQSINFEVFITTAANSITVEIDNLQTNPKSDVQGISGFNFTLNAYDPNAPTLGTPTGSLIDITSKTTAATPDSSPINSWDVMSTATGMQTTVSLSAFVNSPPDDLVIGTAPGNIYSQANSSITGHNPFIKQTATFVITLGGNIIDSTTTVSGANASFNVGTQTPQTTAAIVATPEPGSLKLLLGAIPIGLYLRKRYRSRAR